MREEVGKCCHTPSDSSYLKVSFFRGFAHPNADRKKGSGPPISLDRNLGPGAQL
jgi:hypothetical protein